MTSGEFFEYRGSQSFGGKLRCEKGEGIEQESKIVRGSDDECICTVIGHHC